MVTRIIRPTGAATKTRQRVRNAGQGATNRDFRRGWQRVAVFSKDG